MLITKEVFDFIGIFLFIAGLILGLGSVTVIDLLGFLGRHSSYWTEATIRSHKVTKPLIWLGIFLAMIGGVITYRSMSEHWLPRLQGLIAVVLILNGLFLSFRVSPHLISKEKQGKSGEILSRQWQFKITISFIFSFLGWWSEVLLLTWFLVSPMRGSLQ